MLSSEIILDSSYPDDRRIIVLRTSFKDIRAFVAVAVDGKRRCIGSTYNNRKAVARELLNHSKRQFYTEVEITCELQAVISIHGALSLADHGDALLISCLNEHLRSLCLKLLMTGCLVQDSGDLPPVSRASLT